MTAVRVYDITIYIHEHNSENIYKIDDDYPIIHLIKTKLKDGLNIFLPTAKDHDIIKVSYIEMLCIYKVECNSYDQSM